ncbi:Heat shock protein 70 family [Penicillium macrosclerotiorum]|uniref:Heat shock protein 70 family n=1 Tax=Penicillium macrosclerotiorum TaxID=303699 RepID=UPI0025478703|nr:Heat shock protein 70 family [Penicillium macrosclerotiorum]KAJ5689947.1 Heat shock protein 70 family [Penicillium macrosclerotiorum]
MVGRSSDNIGTRPIFCIGIDFGTTFSGIGWAWDDCADDIEVVQGWPGAGNSKSPVNIKNGSSLKTKIETSQKVPTVLSYCGGRLKWGYQVDDMNEEAVKRVKLLLESQGDPIYGPAAQSKAVIESLNKTPIQVAGEYLKKLVSHARCLLDRRGFGNALDTMDLQYILTVPAVWSDRAKDATMQAACLAGIPRSNLTLLSEPEAAAVYTIRAIQPNSIAVSAQEA